eukprot:6492559-Amphidinium_carterae.5
MVESEGCSDGSDVWQCLVCDGGGGVCRLGRRSSTPRWGPGAQNPTGFLNVSAEYTTLLRLHTMWSSSKLSPWVCERAVDVEQSISLELHSLHFGMDVLRVDVHEVELWVVVVDVEVVVDRVVDTICKAMHKLKWRDAQRNPLYTRPPFS